MVVQDALIGRWRIERGNKDTAAPRYRYPCRRGFMRVVVPDFVLLFLISPDFILVAPDPGCALHRTLAATIGRSFAPPYGVVASNHA
jgi:hypothetical protein